MASRWARTLTTETPNPQLDLADYVGQRRATFSFAIVDNVTGYRRVVNPIRNTVPTLTHDTDRVIKRQIMGLYLGVDDTAAFNTITSRLHVQMLLDDILYPLGRYVPNAHIVFNSTGGDQSSTTFYDEGFIVDQELPTGFGSQTAGEPLQSTLTRCLEPLPIEFTIEPSPFGATVSWGSGTRRGFIIDQMAIDGDWFSPWFDNSSVMRFIRAFNPATAIPTFDLDNGNSVIRDKITTSTDLITAPNQFVVISNGASSLSGGGPVFGVYDVPDSAPHSALNRGFLVTKTENRQLAYSTQAQAVAESLGQRQIIYESVELYTAPDPRHDGYDVLRWRGENWLEVAWSLPLIEGSQMQHVARKAYM